MRHDLSQEGAAHIIQKYTGRAPDTTAEAPIPSLEIPKSGNERPVGRILSPRQLSSNFENILQDAAKGVYTRGEKWGINKAVRDAVEEVRKGVRDIQSSQTPQGTQRHSRTQSRSSFNSSIQRGLEGRKRISPLQQRNEALAKMLKNATDELWDFQKQVADAKTVDEDSVKALSMAIARVQFVQVYLEDPSIPLAVEEESNKTESETQPQPEVQGESGVSQDPQTLESISEPVDEQTTAKDDDRDNDVAHATDQLSPSEPAIEQSQFTANAPVPLPQPPVQPAQPALPINLSAPRPSLAHSSFSWMLGQDARPVSFVNAGPMPSEKRRSKGFLFGDDDDDGVIPQEPENGGPKLVASGSEGKGRGGKGKGRKVVRGRQQGEEKGFDLSTLKEG